MSAAEPGIDEIVLREHTFSNGETYKYMTIGNEVVDADVILGTVEELEQAFGEYEEYLLTGDTKINAQGAMYEPYCDFRIIFCFVGAGAPWPNNTVYFDLGSIYGAFTDDQTRIVWAAIKHITDNTNLKIKGTDDRAIRNKIKFTKQCQRRLFK